MSEEFLFHNCNPNFRFSKFLEFSDLLNSVLGLSRPLQDALKAGYPSELCTLIWITFDGSYVNP